MATSTFKVLAIDGGGIRGIIPALVLAELETRMGRRVYDCFDLISGTSTGGILALGLVKPGADGKAERSASDLVQLYQQEGDTIFPQSFLTGLHVGAIRGAKYHPRGIDATLQKYFGDARLKDALKPVLVPTYDIEKQTPVFFKSAKAVVDPAYDFLMRDVARATSAAPTYFPPQKISIRDPLEYYALIDGGVVAGNPAMCAYAEAVRVLRDRGGDPSAISLLSLGTGELRQPITYEHASVWGQLEWAQPIIDIVMQGSNTTVDYHLQQLLQPTGDQASYFRLQLELTTEYAGMDDARPVTLKHLMDLTQDYLDHPNTKEDLDRVCALLAV